MISEYIKQFSQLLHLYLKTEIKQLESMIQLAPEKVAGDLAFPCFQFAKTQRKAPAQIAQEIASFLSGQELGIFEKIEAI